MDHQLDAATVYVHLLVKHRPVVDILRSVLVQDLSRWLLGDGVDNILDAVILFVHVSHHARRRGADLPSTCPVESLPAVAASIRIPSKYIRIAKWPLRLIAHWVFDHSSR